MMSSQAKISILSTNLSTNCTNRCLRLAQALQPHYRVELIGPTFGVGTLAGEGLWPPLAGVDIPVRSVRGDRLPQFLPEIGKLLQLCDGDLLLACKPRFPSYGVALLKRRLSGKPVVLDIDDDELAMTLPGKNAAWYRKLLHTEAYLHTRWTHRLHDRADAKLVVSENFRQRYGGVLVPHPMDGREIDPARYDCAQIRAELGITPQHVVLGFMGTPNPHKGIDLILAALERIDRPELIALVVGAAPSDPYVNKLASQYGERLKLLPMQPIARIPYFLASMDLVTLPQRAGAETWGQMPAKLTDAMAMAKPILAAGTADIPSYLEGRGLLFEPGDLAGFVTRVEWFLQHRDEADAMGQRARQYFASHLEMHVVGDLLQGIIEPLLPRGLRRG